MGEFWNSAGGAALGMLGSIGSGIGGYKRQKKLMKRQYKYQSMLNQQGHDLQMDMWNKTNFGAQMEHLKDAGLNPGLMYSQGGTPGTTGSQTGGAASGAPQAEKFMDMQSALLAAQIKDTEAAANLKNEGAKTEGSKRGDLDAKAELSKALANVQIFEGNYLNNNEDKIIEGRLAAFRETKADADLKEGILAMQKNGFSNTSIATVLSTVFGIDPLEKGVMDKKVNILPGPMKALMQQLGIDPKLTSVSNRTIVQSAVGAYIAGKITSDILDKAIQFLGGKAGQMLLGGGTSIGGFGSFSKNY